MPQPAKSILLQILSEARQKDITLGKTQLVKLLYLTEVEFYRDTTERLTDLDWLFYHYGPYAHGIDTILEEQEFEVEKKGTKTEREVYLYSISEPVSNYSTFVNAKISLLVKKIVGEWGQRQLAELLDYVYFETEPMIAVGQRGEKLDFTTIKKETSPSIIPLKASKEVQQKVSKLRERLGPRLKQLSESRKVSQNEGKEYVEAMEAWNEEMVSEHDAEELKKVILTINKPFDDTSKKRN